jgi:hypothetical protein
MDKRYETPKVIASLDALDMINDADGLAVGACGSQCDRHEAPPSKTPPGAANKV